MKRRPSPLTLLLLAVVLALGVAGTATAAKMIDGKTIKAGTVTTKQLKDGTVKKKDLAKAVKKQLGVPGPAGPQGPAALPKVHSTQAPNANFAANTQVQVGAQSLPVGTYVTTATVNLVSTSDGLGSCTIQLGGNVLDEGQFDFPTGGGRNSFTLVAVVTTTAALSPTLVCEAPGTGAATSIAFVSIPVV
ncbi:hypothetical protein [Nocardioides sp.]|uniref:hypothetical protein n=1 Tax=Nocardioides sp. TaxID=35761 RepID=UPI001A2C6CEA|nr:hypothetical protein [Nocardioides sp.]MBJ7358527.1 hypothetical protein [Nocardioides sp.]